MVVKLYARDELNETVSAEHLGKKLEEVAESNYFQTIRKYQDRLIELISSDKLSILPQTRKENSVFLKQPLQDISISRSNERAKTGEFLSQAMTSQRIYVWFDACHYQSGIGFGWDEANTKKMVATDAHVIGKGISDFMLYWPAFLLSAGLETQNKFLFMVT